MSGINGELEPVLRAVDGLGKTLAAGFDEARRDRQEIRKDLHAYDNRLVRQEERLLAHTSPTRREKAKTAATWPGFLESRFGQIATALAALLSLTGWIFGGASFAAWLGRILGP